jgi:hypothetical protein
VFGDAAGAVLPEVVRKYEAFLVAHRVYASHKSRVLEESLNTKFSSDDLLGE